MGEGDLLKAEVEAFVNTVNTVGVMGKGIALQFKRAFPANFKAYKKACDRNNIHLGKMFVQKVEAKHGTLPRLIVNFPTKKHWRNDSKPEYIDRGLDDLARVIERRSIASIAIPALGCGEGGLDWDWVQEKIREKLEHLSGVEVHLFAPKGLQVRTAGTDSQSKDIEIPFSLATSEDHGSRRLADVEEGQQIETGRGVPSERRLIPRRKRFGVGDLIDAGLLEPGTLLTLTLPRIGTYRAHVLRDGRIELNGATYSSLSRAERAAAGTRGNRGWTVWRTPKGESLADLRNLLRVCSDSQNAEGARDGAPSLF